MASRRKAREAALQILFFMEQGRLPAKQAMTLFFDHFAAAEELRPYCEIVVLGVEERRAEIDKMIARYSEHWKLSRMESVDRNILRLAVFELLHQPDVPKKVAINEAIEIGKKYGSEHSSAFINGILDRLSGLHDDPAAPKAAQEVRG